MRNGQNKRMRNRNRKGQNPMTRVFESNGPDVKIRGTASHIADKYVQLARDALGSGDPVAAENYYQHAEHYFRIIAAAQEQFRQNQPPYRNDSEARDDMDDDGDNASYENEPGYSAREHNPYPAREPQPFMGSDDARGDDGEGDAPPAREMRRHDNPRHDNHRNDGHRNENGGRRDQFGRNLHRRDHMRNRDNPRDNNEPRTPAPNPAGDVRAIDRLPAFITGGQSTVPVSDAEGPASPERNLRRRRKPAGRGENAGSGEDLATSGVE